MVVGRRAKWGHGAWDAALRGCNSYSMTAECVVGSPAELCRPQVTRALLPSPLLSLSLSSYPSPVRLMPLNPNRSHRTFCSLFPSSHSLPTSPLPPGVHFQLLCLPPTFLTHFLSFIYNARYSSPPLLLFYSHQHLLPLKNTP